EVEERVDTTVLTLEVLAEDWQPALRLVVERLRGFEIEEARRSPYRAGGGSAAGRVDVAAAGFQPRIELERILGMHIRLTVSPGMEVKADGVRSLASRSIGPALGLTG